MNFLNLVGFSHLIFQQKDLQVSETRICFHNYDCGLWVKKEEEEEKGLKTALKLC